MVAFSKSARAVSVPRNTGALRRFFADGEIAIAFSFNPAEPASAVAAGELPDSVRSFVFEGGTLGNTHFLAIPFNASAPAGAMVFADFLMSPEAQARKQDPAVWGDPTVLALDELAPADRRARGRAPGREPHRRSQDADDAPRCEGAAGDRRRRQVEVPAPTDRRHERAHGVEPRAPMQQEVDGHGHQRGNSLP